MKFIEESNKNSHSVYNNTSFEFNVEFLKYTWNSNGSRTGVRWKLYIKNRKKKKHFEANIKRTKTVALAKETPVTRLNWKRMINEIILFDKIKTK